MAFATEPKAEVDLHTAVASTETTPFPHAPLTPTFISTGHKAVFGIAGAVLGASATCSIAADGTVTTAGGGAYVTITSASAAGLGLWVREVSV